MSDWDELAAGMDVLSSDGLKLGRIKQVLEDGKSFRVDCPLAPDYYVPLEAIAHVDTHSVHLRVSKTRAANMGWEVRPHAE